MLRRSSRRLRSPRLVLLALVLVLVPACASQTLTATPMMTPSAPGAAAGAGAPLIAASPVVVSGNAVASAMKKSVAAKRPASAGTRHSTAKGTAASAGSTGGVVYGLAAPELLALSPAEQVQQLEAIKATGVTSVRVDASWYNTEANGPGTYNWAPIDAIVSSIQQAGLTADLIIDGCPAWAAASGASGQFAQPASPTAFGAWAAAVAQRYASKGADYFEIWNEPNNPAFWSPAPNPAAYTADLIAAYAAIKAVDPSAVVLTGGLAPQANSSNSYDIVTFFEDMYADGAQGSFDGVGDHPYTYPYTPQNQTLGSAWSEMSQTSPSLRSLMIQHGDSAKKIWITEYGAPTAGVSEAQQSDELTQAIAAVRQFSWIGSFYMYTWEDTSDDSFGLLDVNGGQKPAYAAVVAALR